MALREKIEVRKPGAEPIEKILRPFVEFTRAEASGGLLLLGLTVVALVWANSPFADAYHSLWQTRVTVAVGSFEIAKPLLLWINDGLMAIFFFVVGLEIKREILVGELASLRQATLPIAAAVGGMVIPALLYFGFTAGTPAISGWAIPMATDIAFALGVLALLGKRAPLALKVFLTALAIVDDLGAVLVIAFFYTEQIVWASLALGAVFLALLVVANLAGVRHPLVYLVLGLALWVAFLKSGVHATIAGVLLALTIPARTLIDAPGFLSNSRFFLDEFEKAGAAGDPRQAGERRQSAVQALETACHYVETPLQKLEHTLHPWVAFFIMPVFALANAGVSIGAGFSQAFTESVTLGIIFGLVIGKQVGITLFSWVSVRLGLAALPAGVGWRHIYGASWLAGIGFTMSLFIASLAFEQAETLTFAKIGILTASVIAGFVGWALLRRTPAPNHS